MKRKTIVDLIAAAVVVVLAIVISNLMASSKTNPERVNKTVRKTISVKPFTAGEISFELPVYGKITPIKKSELYAEVNGILLQTSKDFLEGVSFRKGETLLHIDDTEAKATLMSQKSNYLNAISKVLPDLKLDFPADYENWRTYLEKLDLHKNTPEPPEASEKKAELYLTSQGVYSAYYNLKTSEARQAKYTVNAPYNGIVTESNIKPGTLVRPGQKIGEFVALGDYELEVYVSDRYLEFIKTESPVSLRAPDGEQEWQGHISRINQRIDSETQTVGVFIRVRGQDLRDGMYLNGKLSGIHFANTMAIPRKLVFDNNYIYTVKNDSSLFKSQIEVIEFLEDQAIISGLESQDVLVYDNLAGAYPGMIVNTKPAK